MKIAVLGGTGAFGRALAHRIAEAGDDDVVIGSRDAERAQATADELGGGRVTGASNEDAVRDVDIVVLAVQADSALDTARAVAPHLGKTPLLSVASLISVQKGVGAFPDPDAVSLAERIQAIVDAPVVAGLHSTSAKSLAAELPDEDTFVCGDDAVAKELALELAAKVVAGRAHDAGPLGAARALEGLTPLIVNLNRHYKLRTGIRITGLDA
ncbi:MAG TPA: NAD(P)-binding domain-containing protein [Gaiellaceae bacterium]|nr:NAD(P)-binding domain-containing protein [Gaiellaceae bacterium]